MPIKTFYLKNATAAGSIQGSLQDGGTAPTAATTTTGWTVGKTVAARFSRMDYNVIQAAGTFSTTDALAGANVAISNSTVGTCWRSENTLDGVFDAGNWTFTTIYRPATASTHTGRLNVKIFKSPNANGSANVTVVDQTSTKLTFTTTAVMSSTATDYFSNTTWSAPSFQMYNEYLFMECQWETVVAGGANGADVRFRVASTANVVTSNFTSRNKTAVIT